MDVSILEKKIDGCKEKKKERESVDLTLET